MWRSLQGSGLTQGSPPSRTLTLVGVALVSGSASPGWSVTSPRPRRPSRECSSLSRPGSLTKTSMRNSSSTSPSSSSSSPSPAASCSTPGEGLGLGGDSVRDKALVPVLCTPLPRVTDAAFNFLLVWYYCTLTIRESILINNGSRCACAAGAGGAPRVPSMGSVLAGVTDALLQDQRLVGFPSLCVHIPVRSHADLVSDRDLS